MSTAFELVAVIYLGLQAAGPFNTRAGEPSVAELPDPEKAKVLPGNEARTLILEEFVRFDPQYVAHRDRLGHRLYSLSRRLADLQAAGNEMGWYSGYLYHRYYLGCRLV